MRYDFFHRTESKNPKTLEFVFCFDTEDVAEALKLAYAAGMPRGSARRGCFQIQTDKGIWSKADESRIDFSTPAKAKKVSFKTWEELEAEEVEKFVENLSGLGLSSSDKTLR